jgi:hypothetical protein
MFSLICRTYTLKTKGHERNYLRKEPTEGEGEKRRQGGEI